MSRGGLGEAEAQLQSARSAWTTNRFNLELSCKLAEACFDRAEFAANNRERAALAEEGIAVAREVVRRSSNSAPGHFFLAMNLGQLARTRTFSALGLVSEMERHFLSAVQSDPGFKFAGPERSLGMLYAEAPGWPTSIGSRSKARAHLQRAVELAPDYPENLLALLEAEWEFGERKRVLSRLPDLTATFERAKASLTGKQYEEDWADWNRRAEKLRKQATTPELIPQGRTRPGDRSR
jgi:tetratricopeptide (TPR) repeat protein